MFRNILFILLITQIVADDCTSLTYNNNNYLFCKSLKNRNNSQNYCKSVGGNLVTIYNNNENNWLYLNRYITDTITDTWIGLISDNNINWYWQYGNSNYTNWLPTTPNGNRKSNCARLLPLLPTY